METLYLTDKAFQERRCGPWSDPRNHRFGRDPSTEQIRRMFQAMRMRCSMAADYLADESFRAPHRGHRCKNGGRLPSRSQILRMAEAIRKHHPRPQTGYSARWIPPRFNRATLQPIEG